MSREHKRKRNSIPRIAFVGLTIIIQIVWLIVMAVKLNAHSAWISACVNLLSIVVVLRLYGRHTSTAMKMPWIMLILAAPVMGLSLFLLFDILGTRAGRGSASAVSGRKWMGAFPRTGRFWRGWNRKTALPATSFTIFPSMKTGLCTKIPASAIWVTGRKRWRP